MAESAALRVAVEQIVLLLREKKQLLGGLPTAIEGMKLSFESIKSSLKDARAGEQSEGVKAWIRQAGEIVYDIEDILDESIPYMREFHGTAPVRFICRSAHSIRHLYAHHQIATRMENLQSHVNKIQFSRPMLPSSSTSEGARSRAAADRLHHRNIFPLSVKEADLVGIKERQEELVDLLFKMPSKLNKIFVVGMGGLGKTTLVRKVYEDGRVKAGFHCHAWITVTSDFTFEKLLRSMMNELFQERNKLLPASIDNMELHPLIENVNKCLRKQRYVIVFDDVWNIQECEIMKMIDALPDDNCGSRVIFTTRVGVKSSGHVYNLEPLPPKEAWHLFCNKAFQSATSEGVCPPVLADISQRIVEQCGGLPLAIKAIAGLLSGKKTVDEWTRFHDSLRSELANNKNLEDIRTILLLSYNNLSESLKNCFLYFSIFPKDYHIECNTLTRLWIAEGFVKTEHQKTMEEVAEGYLENLIDFSMVQVAEAEHNDYRRFRTCRVHGIFHKIIALKADEENFCRSLITQNPNIHERMRRLSIHDTVEDVPHNVSFRHIRALFIFEPRSMSFMSKFFSSFRSLRVLNLDGAPIDRFPGGFKNLLQLRYLSLRNTKISKLSKSIGNLKLLETLNLKGTCVTTLPEEITKMKNLRHLLACRYGTESQPPVYYISGVKVPRGIWKLKSLQRLSYLEANRDSSIIKELGNLTQLRRLGIVRLRTTDGMNLCTSIAKLNQLRCLSVTSIDTDQLDLEEISPVPSSLKHLYLRGSLQALPAWVDYLKNLDRLHLRGSNLQENSLEILQNLPTLAELILIQAYDGMKLEFGGFQQLKILYLEQLEIKSCVIQSGAMQNLQKMIIRKCEQLERVPSGIRQLTNLKELNLTGMAEVFVKSLQRADGTYHQEVVHIQKITFT